MFIYVIENKINNKKYVGQTTQELKQRLHAHYTEWSNNYLKNAMRKYGEDNFSITLLDVATTKDELNDKERYWIKRLNTISPNGYNLTFGGDQQVKVSESTKCKLSISRKNYINTHPEYRDWCTQRFSGIGNGMYGKTQSKETRELISSSTKGRIAWNKGLASSLRGTQRSQEIKDKISKAHKGKKFTEEHRKKLSQAHKGKKRTPCIVGGWTS